MRTSRFCPSLMHDETDNFDSTIDAETNLLPAYISVIWDYSLSYSWGMSPTPCIMLISREDFAYPKVSFKRHQIIKIFKHPKPLPPNSCLFSGLLVIHTNPTKMFRF